MSKEISKEEQNATDIRASAGYVKDYYKAASQVGFSNAPNPSKEELDDFLNIYKKDAIVAGAVDTVGEEVVRNKGYFNGSKHAVKKATELFEKLDFYAIAEIDVKTKHIYGDSFIEMKPGDNGEPVGELNNLETTEIFIEYDVHGKIQKYIQRPWNVSTIGLELSQPTHTWNPDEVMFLPLKRLGSKVRSYFPLEPAIRSLTAREYGHFFLETTFKNFRPQTIYSTPDTNLSPDQTNMIVNAIRACDKDPSKKIFSLGPLNVQNTGMYDFKRDIVDILNYLRQEILTVTKVPGIYVGIATDTNRGSGEFQANAFQSHLLRLQRDVEKLGNTVLKKAGINAKFKMKPPSIKSQTDIIDQAKKLVDMGYGDDIITPFLYENGISIPEGAMFKKEEPESSDGDSREPSKKTVAEKAANLDENGRSNAGKEKMEETDSKVRSSWNPLKRFKLIK